MKAIYLPEVPFESLYVPHILKEIYIDKVFKHLKPCDVIVDVGANIGLTAMYLKDFGKQVYALEPATIHYDTLLQNAYMNQWHNVIPRKMAISHITTQARLSLNPENRTMNSLVWDNYDGEMVKCKTFADFMGGENIETIDFCKLDVEGAEEAILLGDGFTLVAPRIKSLLVEFHDFNITRSLLNHMVRLGYNYDKVPAEAILYWFER
jgi:FkbM family methyltransferase